MFTTTLLLFMAYVCYKCCQAMSDAPRMAGSDLQSSINEEFDETLSNIYAQLIDAGMTDLIPQVSLELVDAERHEVKLNIQGVPEEQQQALLSAIRGTGLRMLDIDITQNKENTDNMEKLTLDDDLQHETEKGIHIDKYIKVEKGAVYNDQGYVTVNNYPDDTTSKETTCANDDEDIHEAIAELYEAIDEKGNKIFNDQRQWYAVYRVLKEYCNYPEKMTDFVDTINNNKWADQNPKCAYGSIKVVQSELPYLSVKVSLWQKYNAVNEKYSKQCVVAQKLMILLGLIK